MINKLTIDFQLAFLTPANGWLSAIFGVLWRAGQKDDNKAKYIFEGQSARIELRL